MLLFHFLVPAHIFCIFFRHYYHYYRHHLYDTTIAALFTEFNILGIWGELVGHYLRTVDLNFF